jgi:hypothetical protein
MSFIDDEHLPMHALEILRVGHGDLIRRDDDGILLIRCGGVEEQGAQRGARRFVTVIHEDGCVGRPTIRLLLPGGQGAQRCDHQERTEHTMTTQVSEEENNLNRLTEAHF